MIYIKSCTGLALCILNVTLFCSLLLDLLQTDGYVWGEILIKGFIIIFLSWIERSLKQEVAYNLLFKTSNFIISHMNRSISHHLPFEFQNLLWTEVMYPILDASYFGVNSLLLCHLGANKREAIPVCPHLASDFDFYNRVFIVDVVPISLSQPSIPLPPDIFQAANWLFFTWNL